MKQKPRPPNQKIAYCTFHNIYMNWWFIRRRKCVVPKHCREFYWCDPAGNLTEKLDPRRPTGWQGPIKPGVRETLDRKESDSASCQVKSNQVPRGDT